MPALLAALAFAQTFSWEGEPYYYTDAGIPARDQSSCCGADLVPEPSTSTEGWDCLCDLTDGECDVNCCCDLDCSYDSYKVGGIFRCTTNGTVEEPTTMTKCHDQIVDTNFRESGVVTAFGGSDGVLCIQYDNSPSRGSYLRDPVATSQLSADQVTAELASLASVQYSTWLAESSDATLGFYQVGAAVQGSGCISGSSTTACTTAVDVLIPAVSVDGGCDGQQTLSFLHDVAPFTCSLGATATTLQSLCSTTLNAQFLQNKQLFTTPTSTATSATRTIYLVDAAAGTAQQVVTTVPVASYDSAAGTCTNALVSYELRLTVGDGGTVDEFAAYITLDTLTTASFAASTPTYGVSFEYPSGATEVRATSGRPGYQRGRPLLVADGTDLRRDGLQMLPRTALGACASGSDGTTQVRWREDTAATCTMRMTVSELESHCTTYASLSAFAQPLIAALNVTDDNDPAIQIGIYGDSHPAMTTDWLNLNIKYQDAAGVSILANGLVPAWSATEQKCSQMLSGIHVRVLYSRVGLQSSPVDKVLGAELILESRDVLAARCPLGESDCLTTVAVTSTTTFVNLDAESFDYVPDSPTVIPKLPYDFFYPFLITRGS